MPFDRRFLDWSLPALPAAVAQLVAEHSRDGFTDLSRMYVVVPGGRAGRRFLELLAEQTEGRNSPPRVLTPYDVPEQLYTPQKPFADELTQDLVWVEAFRGCASEHVRKIVGEPPADEDTKGWLSIGRVLSALHRELAADGLDFADVAKSQLIHEAAEQERWQALRLVQESYLGTLDALGLWDRQTARRVAIERRECRLDRPLALIGLVDMNRTLRRMLAQVQDQVTILVHAPVSMSARFEEDGTLKSEAWETADLQLPDDMFQFADGPDDQAERVVEILSRLDELRADDVVIGLADETLAPAVRSALGGEGVSTRWISSRSIGMTGPFQLLSGIVDWLESDQTVNTAALIRHPDVSRWLTQRRLPAEWLSDVDKLIAESVPRRLGKGPSRHNNANVARDVAKELDRWLSPLLGSPRRLGDWSRELAAVLSEIYGKRSFDRAVREDREAAAALENIQSAMTAQAGIPEPLAFTCTAAASIDLALGSIAGELIPVPDPDAIEMLGWLELPLDDAPDLIVVGFNEGLVPKAVNGDLFLPNGLREHLGLEDNRRRLARDAYAVCALHASRRSVTFIGGRRDAGGDPLLPSRLVFAADAETIARRARRIFTERTSEAAPAASEKDQPFGFFIPKPRTDILRPNSLRVTAFRDYIACRYRYYLKYVEKLKAVDDAASELDGRTYGTLLHEVLSQWGTGKLKNSRDEAAIAKELQRLLTLEAFEQYDADPTPSLRLQLKQAEQRLAAFAHWQANWAEQEWQIEMIEAEAEFDFPLSHGKSVRLKGRIDRIDRNRTTGEWMVFDYKTGDSGDAPEKAHFTNGQWIDVQLPLYRHLAKALGITQPVRLAYILLPKSASKAKEYIAKWDDEALASADEQVRIAAEHILNGDFWPPASSPPDFDDFGSICMEKVFGRESLG
jgi:RecB family exonuclease